MCKNLAYSPLRKMDYLILLLVYCMEMTGYAPRVAAKETDMNSAPHPVSRMNRRIILPDGRKFQGNRKKNNIRVSKVRCATMRQQKTGAAFVVCRPGLRLAESFNEILFSSFDRNQVLLGNLLALISFSVMSSPT